MDLSHQKKIVPLKILYEHKPEITLENKHGLKHLNIEMFL